MKSSRRIEDLAPVVGGPARELKRLCAADGVPILIYRTYRDPWEQARLWRGSRTTRQIVDKIAKLRARGFGYLADILRDVGAQYGKLGQHVTWAAPGESYHNYKRALDAVPLDEDGSPTWDTDSLSWGIYGTNVERVGLTWGGDWARFPDLPHAQMHAPGNPLKSFAPDQIHTIAADLGWLNTENR